MARFCYDCGSPLPSDPVTSNDESSSESSSDDSPLHQETVAADTTPAPRQSKKRKRRSKGQTPDSVHVWRSQWDNPHRLGGSIVALRLRRLRPDVTLDILEEVLAGVSAKCRIKVDAGKLGAHGRVRSNCAEITFPIIEAADESRRVLEARPDLFVNPKGMSMRIVRVHL